MKTLIALCCFVVGVGYADPLTPSSSASLFTQVIVRETLMKLAQDCPPALNQKGLEVACAHYEGRDPLTFMRRLDEVLYSFSVYPDTFPELAGLELTPRTPYWIFLPEYGRYERSFDLDGGSYRIIYVPLGMLSSNITVVYTPKRIQT